ncbi:MAG: endonuclease/exonuclease/phosphatase family protein [Muribaculaceae bacterium]|nr:endonuclease/exonuclease/phosphatase family protein [Muribaculaceae bacterium]
MEGKSNRQVPDELKPVVNAPRRTSRHETAPPPKRTAKPRQASALRSRAAAQHRRPHSVWRRIANVMLCIGTLISAGGLIAACFGGNISPASCRGLCLMVMTLPAWLILMTVFTIFDLLWYRRILPVCVLVFIACAAGIWEFMPLNLRRPSLDKATEYPQFTFLTYNITNFTDLTGKYPGDVNPTVSNILKINADVVNLQEAVVLAPDKSIRLGQEQIDSLHRAYPYILMYGHSQMLMSKYPAEAIHIGYNENRRGEIAAFRLNIEGETVTIFDVHLKSFYLTENDKNLYKDVTGIKDVRKDITDIKGTIFDVKSQLLSKVQEAAEDRELDARRLGNLIAHYGGPNVIVAGDFNDVPGCFTLRYLADFKLKQAYSQLGFGPMITFNRDRFYFRIDHVLYRGALMPLRMRRGSSLASDHYPLLVRFALTSTTDNH